MSTRMYNYRLPKECWWQFAGLCREYYRGYHPMMTALREITDTATEHPYQRVSKLVDALMEDDWSVDLQVFDEGETVLIRPLEHGYFFMNNADEWAGLGLERVYYDNRSDVPPEDEKNEAVAKWVDEKITAREYVVYTLLNREDFMSVAFDQLVANGRPM